MTHVVISTLPLRALHTGIALFAWLASKAGYKTPDGIEFADVCMVGFIASVGLTVALFISGETVGLQKGASPAPIKSYEWFCLKKMRKII